jgi:hypothetical protein
MDDRETTMKGWTGEWSLMTVVGFIRSAMSR